MLATDVKILRAGYLAIFMLWSHNQEPSGVSLGPNFETVVRGTTVYGHVSGMNLILSVLWTDFEKKSDRRVILSSLSDAVDGDTCLAAHSSLPLSLM